MKKIFWPFLIAVFFLSCAAIIFYQALNHRRHLGHLYLNVQGSNATVTLNGIDLGAAPITDYQALAGFYDLSITTDHYTYTTTIRLTPQTATIVDWQSSSTLENSSGLIYELIPLASSNDNQLLIQTLPDRALLALNTARQNEFTPFQSNQLNPGNYHALLSLPGYDNLNFSFTISNGYQLKITAKLAQTQADS